MSEERVETLPIQMHTAAFWSRGGYVEEVYNDQGGALVKGDIVYIKSWDATGNHYKVAKADANSTTARERQAAFVVLESIASAKNGWAANEAEVSGLNTAAGSVGAPVYLSDTAGGWTLTAPTQNVQVIGEVTVVGASGKIRFLMPKLISTTTGGMSDGTAALPGLAFLADLDTGFHRPAANTLAVCSTGAIAAFFEATAGAPAASATKAVLTLGSTALSGGSASGTYLGWNATTLYAGNHVDVKQNSVSLFRLASIASAVNGLELQAAATTVTPTLSAIGGDANVGLVIQTKGTGSLILRSAGAATGNVYVDVWNGAAFVDMITAASAARPTLALSAAGGSTVGGVAPASVATTPGTNAETVLAITGATGGATTIATTGAGGVGGPITFTAGNGGVASAAVTAATGGDGGAITVTTGDGAATAVAGAGDGTGGAGGALTVRSGAGGAVTTSTGTNLGGAGGTLSVLAGAGGAATGGTDTGGAGGGILITAGAGGNADTGGAGGSVTVTAGAVGTGGAPTVGDVLVRTSVDVGSRVVVQARAGAAYANIIVATAAARPTLALSAAGGSTVGGLAPASVATTPGTNAETVLAVTGATGGATTIATTGAGGVGGPITFTAGNGGVASAAVTAATGGDGGAITVTTGDGAATAVAGAGDGTGGAGGALTVRSGAGGAVTTSTGTNLGGAGGTLSVLAGAGGAAQDGTDTGGAGGGILITAGAGGNADTGGAGGSVTVTAGAVGTGGSPTVGDVILRTSVNIGSRVILQARDVDGAVYDNVILITAGNTPTCTIAADGGVTVGSAGVPVSVLGGIKRTSFWEMFEDFNMQTITEADTSLVLNLAGGGADPVINAQERGVAICNTVVGAAEADGSQMVISVPVQADSGGLVFECRLHINTAVTNVCVNVGLTDNQAYEVPTEITAGAYATNFSDGCVFAYDTNATVDEWHCVGVDTNVDATGIGASGVAPTADVYQVFRIEVAADGVSATFYIGGTLVKTLTLNATSPDVNLYGTVVVESRAAAAARSVDVDYIHVMHTR